MKHNWENYFDISSEYWKKVEKIYEESEPFPKIVVKERNLHHKFPRSFSKKDGVDIDNDEDNLVSLSISDHFLVHYYLWKCSKKGYRGMMALAFNFMRKKMVKYASEETIERLARDYENVMKDVHRRENLSKETKKKISAASRGKPKPLMTTEHRKNISEANKGKNKGKHRSEEAKNKIGAAKKGTRWYNNGEIEISAKECPLGFTPGRLKRK